MADPRNLLDDLLARLASGNIVAMKDKMARAMVLASEVGVDVRDEHGLIIPNSLRREGRAQWSFRFKNNGHVAPDFLIMDAGIRCTMRFAEGPFEVFVPWRAAVELWYRATEAAKAAIEGKN